MTEEKRLGKRIDECLAAKGWLQTDLLERVPKLSKAALSALITRNSATSTFAPAIAKALGANLLWLLEGKGEQWVGTPPVSLPHEPATPKEVSEFPGTYNGNLPAWQKEVVELMPYLTEKQQKDIIKRIRRLAVQNKEVFRVLSNHEGRSP